MKLGFIYLVYTNQSGAVSLTSLTFDIAGPFGTPYYSGIFRVVLKFGSEFPQSPPTGTMLTKIFHPNVSKTGEICVSTLKKDWKSDLGLKHVITIIRCLLIEPNPESALNEEAGKLLLENYEDYAKRASMYTKIHATGLNGNKESGGLKETKEIYKEVAENTSKSANEAKQVHFQAVSVVPSKNPVKHISKKSITRL